MAAMGSSKRFVLILSAQKPLVTFLLAHKAKDKCRRSVIIMLCCQKIAFVQGGGMSTPAIGGITSTSVH